MRKEVIFLLILIVIFLASCSQNISEENIAGEAGKVNPNLLRTYLSCVDSDGGNNPKILGTITVQYKELGKQIKETQRDACGLSKQREYYCVGKVPKYKDISCLYGCLNGVCKQKTPSCTAGLTGNYRCNGNVREQEIRNVTCSIKWQTVTNCQYGCSNNDCLTSPPQKFLTLIVVSEAGGQLYNNSNYATLLKTRADDNVQIVDVVMWDNGNADNPKLISVYKFDRTFDPSTPEYADGGQAWVDYRESFNLLNVEVPIHQNNMPWDSSAYLNAFKLIVKTIIENQPAEHYGIKYLGHGTSDGAIFGYRLFQPEAESFLAYANSLIGGKLDFLDWSTPCGMGTFQQVKSEYNYTRYIVDSDLERWDVTRDGTNENDYFRLNPEKNLATFFSPSKTIKQSLIDMLNSLRTLWETSTAKNDMISNQKKQSVGIYDTSKFEDLMNSAHLEEMPPGDVLNYIRTNYPEQEQKFNDFRFYYINNKDFFPWNVDSNGFRKN